MKAYFCAIAMLALAASAFAVENEWQNLNRIRQGQKIEVVQTNMVKHTGKFVAFTDEGITLRVDGTERTIERSQVARISSPHSARRALLCAAGAFGGFTAGGLIAHGVASRSHTILADLGGGAAGAVAGVVAGGLASSPTTYYRQKK